MSYSGKKVVAEFRKKYGIIKPDLNELRKIISSQGYTVIEFNAIYNDANVAAIIEELNLDNLISERKGFTYADASNRLVFLHEDLSYDEKLNVLVHEEGHIFCGHIEEKEFIGRDVQQEQEANEFAHYLMNPTFLDKSRCFIGKHKLCISIVAVLLTVCIVGVSLLAGEQSYYGEYYVTETGSKYHKADCIHIKNKTNIRRLTKEEFNTGEYEPCEMCLPNG